VEAGEGVLEHSVEGGQGRNEQVEGTSHDKPKVAVGGQRWRQEDVVSRGGGCKRRWRGKIHQNEAPDILNER
jgi:hypothetical protein